MSLNHICIVGGGLAGASAAHALLPHARITLLEAASPAAGASGVAAGLAHPFLGRKALPISDRHERLAALEAMLELAGLGRPAPGVCRPAADPDQARVFARRAHEHPDALRWCEAPTAKHLWPEVAAPHGALWVREGRAVDVAALVTRLVERVRQHGVDVRCRSAVVSLLETPDSVRITTADGAEVVADATLLCTGQAAWTLVGDLTLHRVKGQVVRLRAPGVARRLPLVAGMGYLVPDGDTVLVGSTFEHRFDHLDPTPEGLAFLQARAAGLVPALAGAELVEARAGVRVTVPGRRHPLLGPVSARGRVWAFNGLGTRGLLAAPFLASSLWNYLHEPRHIPADIRPRTA